MAVPVKTASSYPWQFHIDPSVLKNPVNLGIFVLQVGVSGYNAYRFVNSLDFIKSVTSITKTGLYQHVPQRITSMGFSHLMGFASVAMRSLYTFHAMGLASLGPYKHAVQGLQFRCALLGAALNGGNKIYEIYQRKKALEKETPPHERQLLIENLSLSMVNLFCVVSAVAQSIIGLKRLAAGATTDSKMLGRLFYGTLAIELLAPLAIPAASWIYTFKTSHKD